MSLWSLASIAIFLALVVVAILAPSAMSFSVVLVYVALWLYLDRRILEHNEGINPRCYTFPRRPVILKHFERFTNPMEAIAREKQLKGWSRKKKEALISENYELLQELSKKHPSTSSG